MHALTIVAAFLAAVPPSLIGAKLTPIRLAAGWPRRRTIRLWAQRDSELAKRGGGDHEAL